MSIRTEHFKSLLDNDTCLNVFEYLKNNIKWEEGIKSKNGFTRLAKSLDIEEDDIVYSLIMDCINKLNTTSKNLKDKNHLAIFGVYLNYYVNGDHYTPNHKHPGTCQIIISLGCNRILQVGKKNYNMENGDVAIFGSSIHGLPKAETKESRISIALFCKII